MIEIIQEDNWNSTQERKGLPKNVKQIGTPDIGDRIYIENSAYQKMHSHGEHEEKMVYVMMGRFDDFAGNACLFVEDVIKMNEVEFNGRLPNWNEDSWGHLYRKLKPEHENMIIVGWAVDICGQLPSMTTQLERIHQTYFGGIHQMLLMLDTLEQEEVFYCNRNGYLKRREGFYIYFDKTIPKQMEESAKNLNVEKNIVKEQREKGEDQKKANQRQEHYREYANRQRKGKLVRASRPVYKRAYSSTLLLLFVITALGYSAFLNYQKMETMEQALNQMSQINEVQAVMQTEVDTIVQVEEVEGVVTDSNLESNLVVLQNTDLTQKENVLQSTEMPSGGSLSPNEEFVQEKNNTQNMEIENSESLSHDEESVQEKNNTQNMEILNNESTVQNIETTHENTSQKVQETTSFTMSEAEKYLKQGYYIVETGDNLANICRRIYNTTAMMDKLCEINDIENPNAIFVGQKLKLPN